MKFKVLIMKNFELAAQLLRESAAFMRDVGEQNPAMKPRMDEAAEKCNHVANSIELDPEGEVSPDLK